MDSTVRISRICSDLRPTSLGKGRLSLADRMSLGATPGASIATIDDYSVSWVRGFGTREKGSQERVTTETIFQAASISKPVFALAVLKLVEQNELDLDTEVDKYLQSWRFPCQDEWRPKVTLRQLLSHSAGTTIHGFAGYPAYGPWPSILQILQGVPPANNLPVLVDQLPGTAFRYSGGGYIIAQQVVTDTTKAQLPELMRELIFGPLGMRNSSYSQPGWSASVQEIAKGHPWNGRPVEGGWNVYPELAAAGLWTTAGDLAILGVELMRSMRGDASKLGLSEASLKKMLQPQLSEEQQGQDYFGLGWFCSGSDRNFHFGHTGENEGYLAEVRFYPALGKGAVVMINSIQGGFIIDEVFGAIGREYQWPEAGNVPSANQDISSIEYVGKYLSSNGTAIIVSQENGRLFVKYGPQDPFALTQDQNGEFFAKAVSLRVRFEGPNGLRPTVLRAFHSGASATFDLVVAD